MCGFGIQKEHFRPHRFDLLYKTNPKEWDFWLNNVGFGEVFDWIGFKWRQPFAYGAKAWISQAEREEMIESRRDNGQMSFFA